MYGSWTENIVLWRIFVWIILDLWDVYTVHICSERAQVRYWKIDLFWKMILRIGLKKYSIKTEKIWWNFYSKLLKKRGNGSKKGETDQQTEMYDFF